MTDHLITLKVDQAIPVDLKGTSSVEIRSDAKGNTLATVKVYDTDPEEAAKKASKIFTALAKKHKIGE